MRIVTVLVGVAFVAANLSAEHAIVGTWKQNRAKIEEPAEANFIVIEPAGEGIKLGNQLGHRFTANFDEKETATSDSPEQRVKLKRLTDRSFELTLISAGTTVRTSQYEVSPDGNTLTRTMTWPNQNDSAGTTVIEIAKRTGGSSKPLPFAGTWEFDPRKTKWTDEDVFTVSQDGDVLRFTRPGTDYVTTVNVKTGETKASGPGVPSDYVSQSRIVNDSTLEETWQSGKMKGVSVYEVSQGGSILTLRATSTYPEGKSMTRVLVYERQ